MMAPKSKEEAIELAEKAKAWVMSEEGMAAMAKVFEKTEAFKTMLNESRKLPCRCNCRR